MDNTTHTFLVSRVNPVPVPKPRPAHLPPDADMTTTIRQSTARRPEDTPVARVFTSRATERSGPRTPATPFWIHHGPDDTLWCSVRPVAQDVYEVYAADGTSTARIDRRAARILPWPRRAQWSARTTGSPQPTTGRVGTWYAWLLYVVTAPLWILFALCVMVYSLFDGTADDNTFRTPARTRWRIAGAGTVLDYRGVSKTYRYASPSLDIRVAYALAVLQTWDRED
ncbi:hypothetical protein ACIRD6_36925 [Streptomyces sp. NPDC102473]|uniref:hypothetical protein n=1 Tax=Streptomyces sp. NPDC102473 TaxID=3366180 RepID=UPI0038179929